MAVTGACAEVVYLTAPTEAEPDYDRAVSNDEIAQAVEERLQPLAEEERVDDPVAPRNAFGI